MTFVLMLASLLLVNTCAVQDAHDGTVVTIEAYLVFERHSAYLVSKLEDVHRPECAVFAGFPPMPDGELRGIGRTQGSSVQQINRFVDEYYRYARVRGGAPRRVRLVGTMRVKRNFERQSVPRSVGNGFGYHRVYRAAVRVEMIEYAD